MPRCFCFFWMRKMFLCILKAFLKSRLQVYPVRVFLIIVLCPILVSHFCHQIERIHAACFEEFFQCLFFHMDITVRVIAALLIRVSLWPIGLVKIASLRISHHIIGFSRDSWMERTLFLFLLFCLSGHLLYFLFFFVQPIHLTPEKWSSIRSVICSLGIYCGLECTLL